MDKTKVLKASGQLAMATLSATGTVLREGIRLLASAAETEPADGADSEDGNLIGDYNFRTKKFDNGTDPYGWYEDDL